jgi:hypothetical protein
MQIKEQVGESGAERMIKVASQGVVKAAGVSGK